MRFRDSFKGLSTGQVWGRNSSEKDAEKCQQALIHGFGDYALTVPVVWLRNFYPETNRLGYIYPMYVKNFRAKFYFLYVRQPILVANETILKRLSGKRKGERSIVRVAKKKDASIQPWNFKKNRGAGAPIKGRPRMRISLGISFWRNFKIISQPKKKSEEKKS